MELSSRRFACREPHSRHLQPAWNKYGQGAFQFQVLILCDKPSLLLYEQIALDALSPEYNVLKVAGNSLGRKATRETKSKISEVCR
jgi:group I intron endonuclease